MSRVTFALFAVFAITVAHGTARSESKYRRVQGDVGNIILGEDLPYGNEAAYKNPIVDSVSVGKLSGFKKLCVRAYLSKPLSKIEHDVRVFVWRFVGVGGKKLEAVYVTVTKPADSAPEINTRDEYAYCWPDFDKEQMELLAYLDVPWIDPVSHVVDRSKGFQFTWENIRGREDFGPAKFDAWRAKHGMKEIKVTVTAYAFSKLAEKASGQDVVKLTPGKDGSVVVKQEFQEEASSGIYGVGTVLAKGSFTIVIDRK